MRYLMVLLKNEGRIALILLPKVNNYNIFQRDLVR